MWRIVRLGADGRMRSYVVKRAGAIAAGPDGALWFTAYTSIGRITTRGEVTTFASTYPPYPTQAAVTITAASQVW
jgi:hypothetical protein